MRSLLPLLLAIYAMSAPQEPGRTATKSPAEEQLATIVRDFRGVMGVAAIDLASGRMLAVNGGTRFPTASTIKTAVMLEAYHQAAEGTLPLDATYTLNESAKVGGSGVLNGLHAGLTLTGADLVQLMIVLSDNTATNMLIERLGTAHVNARLDGYGLRETRLFRPTFRDGRADVLPELEREFGLGMSTPIEMAKLMALIGSGKAVDAKASESMLATLRKQQDRAMIPRLLPSLRGLTIGNKTGTDEEKHAGTDGVRRHVRADAGIVTGPGFSYAVAIYARQIEDTRWGIENDALTTGARISRLLFDHFSSAR
ncbi:MAG TPA: serine hydrolase [Vicinamibacterales bacterium]|nr:serine hydrolase [Vicinamibacterales bacterium]